MLRTLRDLVRTNWEFACGAGLLLIVLAIAVASFFAPYSPIDVYVVAPDMPPGGDFWLGTTSRGQDVFWQLAASLRNTLLFGVMVAVISRVIALLVGLFAGYLGGTGDRLLMIVNDTFVVLPIFPILVLCYFVLRDQMNWILLACVTGCLGWAYDARLIRAVAVSVKTREFTTHSVFSGMGAGEIVLREHLPYVAPILFSTTMNNLNWSIGLEVTLSVLGFTDINRPSIGGMIYWANQHTALVSGVWWWIAAPVVAVVMLFVSLFLLAISMSEYIDPRSRLARLGRRGMSPVLAVEGLRAYYRVNAFGVTREVRAVDDISLAVAPNEIYGVAGESSSGKSSLVKTIARAIRPPLEVVGGSVRYDFGAGAEDLYRMPAARLAEIRWRSLSYIMQGSMSVLNPVRRIRHAFDDFARPHMPGARAEVRAAVEAHLEHMRLPASVLERFPHELSGGMRQRVTIALATVCRPRFIIADEPTTALDVIVQKDVLDLLRRIQREMGSSMLFVTHDMAVHAHLSDRLGIIYAGRLVEEGATRDLFRRPLHPYTAHLIESLPRIGDTATKRGLAGRPPSLAAPPPGCRFHPRCPLAMPICREQVPVLETLAPGHRVACHAAGQMRVAA